MQENRDLQVERDRLAGSGSAVDSQGVMERATIKELGGQVAKLEADNAHLKEDVAFFEAATAGRTPATAVDAASGIALRRFPGHGRQGDASRPLSSAADAGRQVEP